jgi:hypothetical protein
VESGAPTCMPVHWVCVYYKSTLGAFLLNSIVTEMALGFTNNSVLLTQHVKLNSNEHRTIHQSFRNHCSQLILYSYNHYYRLIALNLVSNTIPHSQVHLSTHKALCSFTVVVHLTLSHYHFFTVIRIRCLAHHYETVLS